MKEDEVIVKKPNCTRLRICSACPFINSDFDRNETDQDEYFRMAMLSIAVEGDNVWTCLHHLHTDKTMKAQCHVGAKELVKAKEYLALTKGE